MERLTNDTKIPFCAIAQCREMPASTVCKDGYCNQRRVYERLREYERIGDIGEEHEWGDYRAGYCDTCGAKMDATPHD